MASNNSPSVPQTPPKRSIRTLRTPLDCPYTLQVLPIFLSIFPLLLPTSSANASPLLSITPYASARRRAVLARFPRSHTPASVAFSPFSPRRGKPTRSFRHGWASHSARSIPSCVRTPCQSLAEDAARSCTGASLSSSFFLLRWTDSPVLSQLRLQRARPFSSASAISRRCCFEVYCRNLSIRFRSVRRVDEDKGGNSCCD
jgi:hypothetical protein